MKPTDNTSDLIRLASLGTAFGFGFGAASMEAWRRTEEGMTFEFSMMTLVAFVVGAAIAVGFWSIVKRALEAESPNLKALKGAVAFLIVLALAGFLYPLRFVAKAKYVDLWIGLGLATLVLTVVGVVLWKLIRFLDEDAKRE